MKCATTEANAAASGARTPVPTPGAGTAPPGSAPHSPPGATKPWGAERRFQISLLCFKLQQNCSTHSQVSQPPESQIRPTLAFPRSSASPTHLPPIPGQETPRPWGWGKGEWRRQKWTVYIKRYPPRPERRRPENPGAEEQEEGRVGTERGRAVRRAGSHRCRCTHSAYPVAQGSRRVSLRMRMGRAMWSALHSTSS